MSVRDNIAMGLYKPRDGGLLAGGLWWRKAIVRERARRAEADHIAQRLHLTAVLDRYAERLTEPTERPAGSRLCEFVAWGVPTYFRGIEVAGGEPS